MSAYKTPIVCKEIYIPVMDDMTKLSPAQYKEKFGIDIIDALGIKLNNSGNIEINYKVFSKVYFVLNRTYTFAPTTGIPLIDPDSISAYEEGSSDASISLLVGQIGFSSWGMVITLSKSDEYIIDNLKISFLEI